MNQYIEQAIDNFRRSAVRYAKTERYYRGDHDLAFATEKFENAFGTLFREFAMNLCPAICDAVKDKLRISGFGVMSEPSASAAGQFDGPSAKSNWPPANAGGSDPGFRPAIDHIWFRNRMQQRAGEIHKEALKNGDAYVIVWFDASGEVTIYPHSAANVTVAYDEDFPGRVLWAAKHWKTPDKRTRLNIFFPDRIERYVTKKEFDTALPDAKEFVHIAGNAGVPPASIGKDESLHEGRVRSGHAIPNPFGVVPVFHFANNADVGCMGQSELFQAIPIQDGLNKSILDMLVAMEFSAYRQRWAAGIEIEYDEDGKPKPPFSSGVERLWVASDANTRFGDFSTTSLDQFLKVKDSFRIDMASVTGTPLHYFLQNSRGFASGESLKQNETRFLAKVRDRQTSFGQVWAELMSFALRLAGHPAVELITHWEDPAPTTESDILQNLLLKKQLGISTEQALREAGYGEIDVKRMMK
jgi:hypothetical protein